ncbi:glycosyltransferase [Photobacterium leiognathi]|uniref:glycosyltransferase n=1 Tax=Photobacterium leiognathi TaxID=553611 RepID=UPI0029815ADC|nr:glycosyltransferase [Photobacterium leiognathi]
MSILISFIIIARNEELVIKKCLGALDETANKIDNIEIILVDSNSSDNTLNCMEKFSQNVSCPTKVITCTGDLNAAVVRNVGFNNASGEFAFFVDGDTEINMKFVENVLDLFKKDKGVLGVTGQLSDYMYDDAFEGVIEIIQDRNRISKKQSVTKFGGNVVLRSDVLKKLGGWDENFTVNEDTELAIRLATYGKIIAIPCLIGNHHTKRSEIYNRSYLELLRGRHSYYGQLLRKNIFSLKSVLMTLKCNKGHVVGLSYYPILISSAIFSIKFSPLFMVPFCCLLIGDFLVGFVKRKSFRDRLITRIIVPTIVIKGFLFPIKKSRYVTYNVIIDNDSRSK